MIITGDLSATELLSTLTAKELCSNGIQVHKVFARKRTTKPRLKKFTGL